MQKSANRILSALLVLVMVLSMLPATVFATGENGSAFTGWDLTLGENISVNFYFDKAYTVNATIAGESAVQTAAEQDGKYVVTVSVPAAQMKDTIGLTAFDGETAVHSGEYSVYQYAQTILSGNEDAEVKELVEKMLNYGAAAQEYFDYNAGNNEIVNDAQIPAEVEELVIEDNLDGIDVYGASLVLRDKIAVRIYFSVSGNIADYTFSAGTPVVSGDYYYVEIADILPQNIDKAVALEVSKGEGKLSVRYSPLNYIVRKSENGSESLKQLMQALYGYHLEAIEYLAYEASKPVVIEGGVMNPVTGYGWTGETGDLIFQMNNSAPTGDYKPLSAGVIKLIRNGETYDVGHTGANVLNKANDTWYSIAFWTIVDYKPMLANDILVIEGDFYQESTNTILTVSKTYVLLKDGGAAEFSTEMPKLPTTVEGGTLNKHSSNGWAANGVYASMAANDAPYNNDWSIEYTPAAAENLKLIRGGETYNIGIPGRGTLVKYNATDYFLKMEWNVGEYAPMQDGDILIVEGAYVNNANKATLNISKTYIYANGSNVEFSTEMPTLATTVEGGVMSAVEGYGWTGATGDLIFQMNNSAPNGDYKPTSAGVIKLIRNGETYDVGHTGANVLHKENDTWYTIAFWTIVDYKPMLANDILVIEGDFYQESTKTTLKVSKTYVLLKDGGAAEFSTEMPTLGTTVEGGVMSAVTGYGWTGGTGDLIFKMDNTAPNGGYKPTSEGNIKLIRNGETYDIAYMGQEVFKKDNDGWYTIPFWTIVNYKPMLANDILVIEGDFYQESTKTTLKVSKTYVLLKDGGAAEFSTEMPNLGTTVEAGAMQTHPDGVMGNGIRFRLDANDAYYVDDWSTEYKQTATSNVKLIRGDETIEIGIVNRPLIVKYSDIDYYLKLEGWSLGNYGWNGQSDPITTDDIIIIEGEFVHTDSNTTLIISKSYVYYDGSAWVCSTEEPERALVVNAGTMNKHSSNGWNGDALYFSMAENAAPIGDSIRYKPEVASNIKLIRDGQTYDVGHTEREAIVKPSETGYYIALWVLGDYKPLKANDILIFEGNFINEANKTILNISKSYILINADGSADFSTEMPTLSTTIEGGVMTAVDGYGWTGETGDLIFKMNNTAPNGGYKPTSEGNIKLIRNGETYDVAYVGVEIFNKSNDGWYTIPFWTIVNYKPMLAGDILVVEGDFYQESSNTILNVSKTYVLLKDSGAAEFSTEMPVLSTIVDCGVMTENEDGSPDDIYFSMAANSIPVDEELAYPYAGTMQVVTGGNAVNVAANIYKLSDEQYYLELDAELADQSYLVVEGEFANGDNGYVMNIAKTYVLNNHGTLVFSTTEPVLEAEFAVTGLTNHSNGWTEGGIYISHNAHSAHIGTDWSVRYRPVSADVIKLVRDGETFNIGQPAGDTLVVYSDTNMYFETKAWTTQGGKLPFVDGDQIIIEGKFKHEASGNVLVVEKTVICVDGSSLVFNPVFVGNLGNHPNGMNSNGEGIYATSAANDAPYSWSHEYTPLTEDAYYVIRGEEIINIGMPGRGTLVKYEADKYYLKMNAWCTNNFAYTTDDIFVIDGFWKHNNSGAIIKIEKTYLYYNGSSWVFADEVSSAIQAGHMKSHSNGMSGNGMYFKMDANAAPYNSDWTLEYKQTSTDAVKLIRGGETLNIGIVGRPLFIKYSETDYYLKLEGWTLGDYMPLTTDDVLIIEGNLYHEASNTTLNVAKSYVYFDGTAWVCSDSEPVKKVVIDVVELGSHGNGWTSGGFYFIAATNSAPFNTDWSLRYKPLSADAIKLVHNGTVTNKGNTGAETIVKYGENQYYIEGWAVGMSGVVAGDQMIIEGEFYNAANDTTIKVEKTTIIFNADGSTTIISESGKYINAGAMSANTAGSNWFGNGIHFALSSNIAPSDSDWNVRYIPKNAANIKLIRNGETVNIANTGAETIVKIADGQYWLSLENWWWNAYAPIQDGDILVIEGEFSNAANGFTLNIDKTYITFVSKENDQVEFAVGDSTEFGDVILPTSSKSVTIGVWNGSHHSFSDARLAELQAAGITKIIGIDPQWIGDENKWDMNYLLDRMQSYGISVIAYPRQRTADGSKYSGDAWDGVTVPDYANHPALIGFLMYDEPSASDFTNLQQLKAKFEAVMPADKLFFVNLYSESAAKSAWYGSVLGSSYKDYESDYIDPFIGKLDPEILSWDSYPLLTGKGIRTGYFHNFELMGTKSQTKWFTLLSSGHDTTSTSYDTPTYEELRWQMAVAMTFGVSNLDHYVYTSHASDYTTMLDYETQTVTDLYYNVKKADNEIKAWDEIYMAYNWKGTAGVKAGTTSTMLDKLEHEIDLTQNGLDAVATNQDLLVGVFDYSGAKAYMVTNAGSAGTKTVGDGKEYITGDATVTLTLDDADYKCVAVIDNGEISYVAVNADNTVTLNVEAYEGVFVIPVLN